MKERVFIWQKRIMILLLAAGLCFMWKIPAQAAAKTGSQTNSKTGTKTEFTKSETAAAINLSKTEGTVKVTKASGGQTDKGTDKEVKIIKNMRLLNGYHVNTEKKSYAWVELDKSKLIKVDAVSEVEVRNSGKVLEVLLDSGNMSFNITESLKSDETLNICTSSMIAGIRGTCGWVQVKSATCTRVYVLEGKLECTVIDSLTGEAKTDYIKGGEWADFIVLDKEQKGEKCVIDRGGFTRDDVPGFVLIDLVGDEKRCGEIFQDSGIDLRGITSAEALERLAEDEAALAELLEELEKAIAEIENNISMDPVWKEEAEESPKVAANDQPEPKKEQPSGFGNNGGSAPAPAPEENKKPDPAPKKETENVDVAKDPKDVENLLDDGKNVTVAGDDTSNIYQVDSDLHIPEGSTLTIKDGLTLAVGAAATITVDGTLKANGDVENNGTLIVNSNKSVHVKGGFVNYGSVINQNKGKIDAAQGIDNYGSVHCDGKSTLYSNSTEGTVRMKGDGCKLTVAGGDITNKKGGAALALEEAGQIDGVTFTEKTLLQSVSKNVVTIAGQALKVKDYATSYNDIEALYQFMIDKKKVTFIGGEGSETRTVSTLNGYALGKSIPKLTRAGYELTGYNTAADGSGSAFTKDTKVTEDITVYAQWKENPVTYTVTFDANGGTLTGEKTVTVPYNGKVTLPAPKAPKGYTFYGWYTEKDSKGVKVTGDEAIVKNVTYYARWILGESKEEEPLPEYKVTFNANGGTLAAGASDTATVKQGEKAAKPADPAREGYTFAGWCTDESCATAYDFTSGVTADITLYAKWTIITYKVTFDTNGGSFADSAAVVSSVNHGGKAVKPADPVKTGYIFEGWYLLNDQGEIGSEKYGFDTPVMKDITLSAVWKPTERTVKFVINTLPDMVLDKVVNKPEDQVVYYDSVVTEPSTEPEYSDYAFDGWYTDEKFETKYDFETKVKGDVTLYAKWTKMLVVRYMLDKGEPVNDAAKETLKKAGYIYEEIMDDGVVKDTALVQYVKHGGTATAPAKALSDLLTRKETKMVVESDPSIGFYEMGDVKNYDGPADGIESMFLGWYKDTALSETYTSTASVTEELTVYAAWERKIYFNKSAKMAISGGAYGNLCGAEYSVVDSLFVMTSTPLRIRNLTDEIVKTAMYVSSDSEDKPADITLAGVKFGILEGSDTRTVNCTADTILRLEKGSGNVTENSIVNNTNCLTISAEKSISILGSDGESLTLDGADGMEADGDITIKGVSLTLEGGGYMGAWEGGSIEISDSTVTGYGIYADNGNISISDSTVTVESDDHGIEANKETGAGELKGNVEISGAKTVVTVINSENSAIYGQNAIRISGGQVTASTLNGNGSETPAGIRSPGAIDISGGTVNVSGVNIGVAGNYINITGGELTANVTDLVDTSRADDMNYSFSDHTAYAIFCKEEFNVTGGKVTISEKDAAEVPYYGVYADVDGTINISGGSVYINAIIGIEMRKEIVISQTGRLDVDFYDYGVKGFQNMTVTGGVSNFTCRNDAKDPTAIYGKNITIEGGTVNANAEDSTRTGTGVLLRDLIAKPVLKVTGGTLNARGAGGSESYGIDLDYNNGKATLLVEGGTVNAINEKGGGGLRVYQAALKGGTVKVQGGTSNHDLIEVQSGGALDSDRITNIDGAGVAARSGATFDTDADIETGWVLDADKLCLYDDNGAANSMYTEYSTDIRTVYVGDDVNEIAPDYFNECVNLTSFEVGANNETFYRSRIDNDYTMYALMSKDPTTSKKTLVRFPTGCEYIIQSYFSGVNIIGPYAFAGCEALIDYTLRWSGNVFSLTAMSNLEAIDEKAFDGWSSRLNQIWITYNDNLSGVIVPGMEINSYPSLGHGNGGGVYWSIQYSADESGYGWGLSVYTAVGSTEKRDLSDSFIRDWGDSSYINLVERIVVKDGIRAVTALAFPEYTNLKEVYLPDALASINKGNLDRFAAKNAKIVWKNKTYYAGTALNEFMDDFLKDDSVVIGEYASVGNGDWNGNYGYFGIKYVKSGNQIMRTFYTYTEKSKGYLPYGPYENDICSSTLADRDPATINRLEIGDNIEVISAGAFPELISLTEVVLSDAVNAIHTDILDNVFFKQSGTVVKWKRTNYSDKGAFKQAFVEAGNDILIATSDNRNDDLKYRIGKGIHAGEEIYNLYFYAVSKNRPQTLTNRETNSVVSNYNSNNIWIHIGDNISGISGDALPDCDKLVGVTIPLGTKTVYKGALNIFFADRSAAGIVTKVLWNGKEYTRENRGEFEKDFKNYTQEDGTSNTIPES